MSPCDIYFIASSQPESQNVHRLFHNLVALRRNADIKNTRGLWNYCKLFYRKCSL